MRIRPGDVKGQDHHAIPLWTTTKPVASSAIGQWGFMMVNVQADAQGFDDTVAKGVRATARKLEKVKCGRASLKAENHRLAF